MIHSHIFILIFYFLFLLGNGLLKVFDADVIVGRIKDPLQEEPELVVLGDPSLAPNSDDFWDKVGQKISKSRQIIKINTRLGITEMGLTEQDCPASGFIFFQDGLVQVMVGRGLRSKDVIWAGTYIDIYIYVLL